MAMWHFDNVWIESVVLVWDQLDLFRNFKEMQACQEQFEKLVSACDVKLNDYYAGEVKFNYTTRKGIQAYSVPDCDMDKLFPDLCTWMMCKKWHFTLIAYDDVVYLHAGSMICDRVFVAPPKWQILKNWIKALPLNNINT